MDVVHVPAVTSLAARGMNARNVGGDHVQGLGGFPDILVSVSGALQGVPDRNQVQLELHRDHLAGSLHGLLEDFVTERLGHAEGPAGIGHAHHGIQIRAQRALIIVSGNIPFRREQLSVC